MTLVVYTGAEYPVKGLKYEVINTSLPRSTVDDARTSLRSLYEADDEVKILENWCKRDVAGCSTLTTMRVLSLAQVTQAFLNDHRHRNSVPSAHDKNSMEAIAGDDVKNSRAHGKEALQKAPWKRLSRRLKLSANEKY